MIVPVREGKQSFLDFVSACCVKAKELSGAEAAVRPLQAHLCWQCSSSCMVSLSMIWCLMPCPFLYAHASVLGVQGFVCTGSCNRLAVSLPSRWNGASLSKLLGLAMSAIQTVLAYAGFVPRWPLERAGLGEAQVAEHVRIGLGPEELPHKDAEEYDGGGRIACDENTSPWRAEDPLHVQLRRLVEGHGGAGEGSMVAVRHISQAYTWDCGLTCLQMVLE